MIANTKGGYNDLKYPTKHNYKSTKEHRLWISMLKRCMLGGEVQLRCPTYIGCTVSDNFCHYSYFYEWCNQQIGFGLDGWTLDKDILYKGNKLYSEFTCCFVPSNINKLFVKGEGNRGLLPIGVTYHKLKKKYYATCSRVGVGVKSSHIGSYNTPEDAFYAYKKVKEEHIKHMADLYKDVIDSRVYEAMYRYKVEITD